ncbi:MAG: glycosyltransferase [Actinomycetes bacterium]
MKISVVIPSYRRTDVLGFCLDALFGQDRLADELIVVVREDDEKSRRFLTSYENVRCVLVNQAGAVHAMAHGALASSGDIICFTDDGARPHRDWLSRIEAGFLAEPGLAALGGRDCIHEADGSPRPTLLTEEVGIFRSYGRLIGNHHRGQGQARRVDVLKGVNSAYRREALALPVGLRDRHGGQFEVVMGAFIQRNGGQLSYDPELQVDHYQTCVKLIINVALPRESRSLATLTT